MDWIIAAAVVLVLGSLLPWAIMSTKKSLRGNARMAGVALSIGMAFSMLHDPRKPETIEHAARREGEDEDGENRGESQVIGSIGSRR